MTKQITVTRSQRVMHCLDPVSPSRAMPTLKIKTAANDSLSDNPFPAPTGW